MLVQLTKNLFLNVKKKFTCKLIEASIESLEMSACRYKSPLFDLMKVEEEIIKTIDYDVCELQVQFPTPDNGNWGTEDIIIARLKLSDYNGWLHVRKAIFMLSTKNEKDEYITKRVEYNVPHEYYEFVVEKKFTRDYYSLEEAIQFRFTISQKMIQALLNLCMKMHFVYTIDTLCPNVRLPRRV